MKTILSTSLLIIFAAAYSAVSAQNFNPTTPALGFNVFTSQNLTATAGSTHGPAAIGGNLVLKGNTVFSMNTSGTYPTNNLNDYNNYGLVVAGKMVYSSGNSSQLNQGFLRIGNLTDTRAFYTDCNNAGTNLKLTPYNQNCNTAFNSQTNLVLQRQQASGSATSAHGIDFGMAFTKFNQYAAAINAYNGASACAAQFNKITIPATPNPHITLADNKINYINLTATELNNLNNLGSIIFDNKPTATRILVFNVAASGSFTWTLANFAGLDEANGNFIIWNFYQTTTLNINGSNAIYGTVFSPAADIVKNNPNNLNGQVIGRSLVIGSGPIHYYPFKGSLPDCSASAVSATLPVKLLFFGGNVQEGKAELKWIVGQNEDANRFQVEKSTNGSDFSAVAFVSGTAAVGSETYLYKEALSTNMYYRLKVVDKNGSIYYSNVLALKAAGKSSQEIEVLQNPLRSSLSFSTQASAGGQATVSLFSITGTKMLTKSILLQKGTNVVNLPLSIHLPSGTYVLEVTTSNSRSTAKLIK